MSHAAGTWSSHSSSTRTGAITELRVLGLRRSTPSTIRRSNALAASNPTRPAAARVPGRSRVLHRDVLLQRNTRRSMIAADRPRTQQIGLLLLLAALVALALVRALAWAVMAPSAPRRDSRSHGHRQERARHCAGASVRRRGRQLRLDRGLSRLRHRHRQGAASLRVRACRIT